MPDPWYPPVLLPDMAFTLPIKISGTLIQPCVYGGIGEIGSMGFRMPVISSV